MQSLIMRPSDLAENFEFGKFFKTINARFIIAFWHIEICVIIIE